MASNQTCYWPDGSIVPTYVSCNIGDGVSPCCLKDEACLQSGLCYGALGLVYRGACTSAAYQEGFCPNYCTQQHPKEWANLHPCQKGSPADHFTSTFWCGNGSICEDKAPLGQFIGLHPDNVLAVAGQPSPAPAGKTTNSSNSTSPSNSTILKESSQNTSRNLETPIILGVGLGLGIPLLALLIAFVILHQRRKKEQKRREEERVRETEEWAQEELKLREELKMRHEQDTAAKWAPQRPQHSELDSPARWEADGRVVPHELSGDQAFMELPVVPKSPIK